jgi:hypothetical protein
MGILHNFQLTALSESSIARYRSFYHIKITRDNSENRQGHAKLIKTHMKKQITNYMAHHFIYISSRIQPVKANPVSRNLNASYYLALGLNPVQVKSKRNVTSFLYAPH